MKPIEIAKYIDHTLLKPEATEAQIRALCQEALQYQFAAVCVNGAHVGVAAETLRDSQILTAAVVGFPLGAMHSKAKAFEAEVAVKMGAKEIDMVMRIDLAKTNQWVALEADIREVVNAVPGAIVKVIFETSFLTLDEMKASCKASEAAGAHYVKTCTGFFAGSEATLEQVQLMRKTVSQQIKVKASGGIRSFEKALAMIEAGADRIGTSSGIAIVSNQKASTSGY